VAHCHGLTVDRSRHDRHDDRVYIHTVIVTVVKLHKNNVTSQYNITNGNMMQGKFVDDDDEDGDDDDDGGNKNNSKLIKIRKQRKQQQQQQ